MPIAKVNKSDKLFVREEREKKRSDDPAFFDMRTCISINVSDVIFYIFYVRYSAVIAEKEAIRRVYNTKPQREEGEGGALQVEIKIMVPSDQVNPIHIHNLHDNHLP